MELFGNSYAFLKEYCKNCSLNYDKILSLTVVRIKTLQKY